MALRSTEKLQKHTLNLYAGDFDELQNMFPEVGASVAIRTLVRNYIESKRPTLSELPNIPEIVL